MANSVMEQGEKYIHKQKKKKQWLIAVACVAVVAVSGTIAGLMLNGHALNHTKRVLDCKLEVHEHEERCYSQEEGEENLLICGYADYVVHLHNDDCYSEDGQLACRLPEIKPHEHSEECYKDQEFLICEQEEIPGHTHGEGCYEMRPVEAAAQEPQDTEGAGPEGTQTEGAEPEAEGTEPGAEGAKPSADQGAAVEEEPVLVCTQEEIEGHQHGDNCYETRRVLACGKLELHTHDEKLCFEEVVDKAGNKHQNLICEEIVLYEHIHGEDCFAVVELTGEEVDQLNEANKDQQLAEGEEGQGEDNPAEGEEGQGEDDPAEGEAGLAEGGEAPEGETEPGEPQEPEEKQFQKVYEDEAIKVTASYNEDAGIPEEAELVVQPAAEDAEADPAEAEAVQALLGEKEPSAKMSYTIGFFVDGQEIEPTGVVTITVQLPEGQQVAPGAPVTVIHYGENGPEAIQGSNVMEKDGKLSVSFDSSAFSKFMIVIGEPEEEPAGENPEGSGEENGDNGENPDGAEEEPKTETVSYKLQDSFLYENDDFRLTLRVTGTATAEMPVEAKTEEPNGDNEEGNGEEEAPGADGEVQEGTDTQKPDTNPEEPDAQEPDATAADDAGVQGEAEASDKPDEGQAAGTGEAENSKKDEVQTQDNSQDGQNSGNEVDQPQEKEPEKLNVDDVKMELQFLGQEDEAYQEIQEFAKKDSGNGKLLELSVMHYSLIYQDVPLDISECDIRVEVALKEKAVQASEVDEDIQGESGEAQEMPEGDTLEEGETISDETVKRTDDTVNTQSERNVVEGEERTTGEGDSGEDTVIGEQLSSEDLMQESGSVEKESQIVSLIKSNGAGYEVADTRNISAECNTALVMKAENLQNDIAAIGYSQVDGPKYTVQYYAYRDEVQTADAFDASNPMIGLIDTSSKANGGTSAVLPQNGVSSVFKYVLLEATAGGKYQIKTGEEPVLKEFFKERSFEFYEAPNLSNVNILSQNMRFALKEVWVLKEGKTAEGEGEEIQRENWDIYDNPSQIKFGYSSASADDHTIQIKADGSTVIRLAYEPTKGNYNNEAMFYDYDVTDGNIYTDSELKNAQNTSSQGNGQYYAKTKEQGINSPGNYEGKGTGTKLAFGNNNIGSGLGSTTWDGQTINMANVANGGFYAGEPGAASWKPNGPRGHGCTYGIVTGLNADGTIRYADGIIAPNLFNEGAAEGKHAIDNWSLNFNRVGDTYTFSSVQGTSVTDLEYFSNLQTKLYTNNFWPMDSSEATYGKDTHDLKFGATSLESNRKFHGEKEGTFPVSDDGGDHNSYFGMQFALEFEYTDDYTGPLEYYFFGDDDMWLFLDGQLICDIGGVHSSNGEYVDLWDYLPKGSGSTHMLDVFYTERGASGSTCYMQFTLPTVSSATVGTTSRTLRVEKEVDGPIDDTKGFEFELNINETNKYPYVIGTLQGIVVDSGYFENGMLYSDDGERKSIELKHGEYLEVKYLPIGTTYTITESEEKGYHASISVNGTVVENDGNIVSGTVEEGNRNAVTVKYTNHTSLELPKTGGFGVIQYTFGGIAVTAAGLMYGYQWKRRRERRNQN